jgi:DNA-binding XRE family transcriptional regulator
MQAKGMLAYHLYVIYTKSIVNVEHNLMTKDYREFKKRLLENPEVRKEYDALQPHFNLIRQEIALRNRLKISQAELAARVGTGQSAISRLETGDANTTVGTWQRVAEALDAELQISLVPKSGAQT